MEPPYQSCPLQQLHRRLSRCSLFPLRAPPPQPPASAAPRAATTPSLSFGARPRPPRYARRRRLLRLRAAAAAATDAAASYAPPSLSLKANKHHGDGAVPQPASAPTATALLTSRPPIGHRRGARPFGSEGWSPHAAAPSPALSPGCGSEPARRASVALSPPLSALLALVPLSFFLSCAVMYFMLLSFVCLGPFTSSSFFPRFP